jgi:hypothetical protein
MVQEREETKNAKKNDDKSPKKREHAQPPLAARPGALVQGTRVQRGRLRGEDSASQGDLLIFVFFFVFSVFFAFFALPWARTA